jgi:ATP-dependent DNA helicase RecG
LPDGSRPGTIKSLKEIRETFYSKYGSRGKLKKNHSVLLCSPVRYKSSGKLPIPAYTMGFLLGDGCFRQGTITFSTCDAEIVETVKSELPPGSNLAVGKRSGDNCDWSIKTTLTGYHMRSRPHPYIAALKKFGLMGLLSHEKFVPELYMTASIKDRLALLQGLLDSDGTCVLNATGSPRVEFCCTSKVLTDQVADLVRSLGGYSKNSKSRRAFYYGKNRERIECKPAYRVGVRLHPNMKPFRLERKLQKWKPPEIRRMRKYIEKIEKNLKDYKLLIKATVADREVVVSDKDYIFKELEKYKLPNKFDDEIEYWNEVKKEIELS